MTHGVPPVVPFSGVDLPGLSAELTFFRDDGTLVHERVPARWSRSPLPQVRCQLEPEQRTLNADDEPAAFAHTSDAMRGGKQPRLDPGDYWARLRIAGGPDEPTGWYRLRVPLMSGLELRGPTRAPQWAPRDQARRPAAGPRAVPRKKSTPRRAQPARRFNRAHAG